MVHPMFERSGSFISNELTAPSSVYFISKNAPQIIIAASFVTSASLNYCISCLISSWNLFSIVIRALIMLIRLTDSILCNVRGFFLRFMLQHRNEVLHFMS